MTEPLTGDDAPCSDICYCERAGLIAELTRMREAKRMAGLIADERSRENVALRVALQEYGDHRYECDVNHDKACTCGYAAALEQRGNTMKWQPIETAPQNGQVVIVYTPPDEQTTSSFSGVWFGSVNEPKYQIHERILVTGMGWDNEGPYGWHPTHWMALPNPPDAPGT